MLAVGSLFETHCFAIGREFASMLWHRGAKIYQLWGKGEWERIVLPHFMENKDASEMLQQQNEGELLARCVQFRFRQLG